MKRAKKKVLKKVNLKYFNFDVQHFYKSLWLIFQRSILARIGLSAGHTVDLAKHRDEMKTTLRTHYVPHLKITPHCRHIVANFFITMPDYTRRHNKWITFWIACQRLMTYWATMRLITGWHLTVCLDRFVRHEWTKIMRFIKDGARQQ